MLDWSEDETLMADMNLTINLRGDLSKKIGSPPRTVIDWIAKFRDDNNIEADRTLNPVTRAKYRGQASGYAETLKLLKQIMDVE